MSIQIKQKIQPSQETIDAMAFPMRALGNVSVGNAQYEAGDIFDAKSIDSLNYLKVAKAADSLSGVTVPPDKALVAVTDVVQTEVPASTEGNTTLDAAPAVVVQHDIENTGSRPSPSTIRRR